MDKNIVIIEGIIGDDFKWGTSQIGKEYATFSLCVNSFIKEIADSTERTHSQVYVRVFCHDKRILEYLRRVNAKRGQRACVFGRITSAKSEYRGITFMSNNVTCRDITIIKTRKENGNNNETE